MTEFVIKPFKRVEIKSIIKIDFEEFQKRRVLEESPPKWCEGVLFQVFPIAETVDTVQEELAGTQHWLYVEITQCEANPKMLKHNGTELVILDVSSNPLFVEFAQWVKTLLIWEAKN